MLEERAALPGNGIRTRPSVLFVGVKNGGESQMPAALMRMLAGDEVEVEVHSAGTKPGNSVNALSADVIAEVCASMLGEVPKPIDPDLLRSVERTNVLGSEAPVEPVDGSAGASRPGRPNSPPRRASTASTGCV